MGYCYSMIWRRTREVRLRVNGYSAFRLTRTRQHNGGSICVAPASTPVPSNNTNVVVHETLRSEPLLSSSDNHHQLAADDDKVLDTYRSTSEQTSDKNRRTDRVIECSQGTVADCPDRLLPAVHKQYVTVEIDRPQMDISDIEEPGDESVEAQGNKHENTATCSGCNNDNNNDNNADYDHIEQTNADNSRRRITSSDYQQQATLSPPASNSRKPTKSPSAHLISSGSTGDVAESEKDGSDSHVMLGIDEQPTANYEAHQLPTRSPTMKHDSISVVITPAAATSSAADVLLRESTTSVVASEVINKSGGIDHDGHLLHHLSEGDVAHLSVGGQQSPTTPRMSPFRRRLLGHDVEELSPASSWRITFKLASFCSKSIRHACFP